MRKRNVLATLGLVFVLALAAAACGGGEEAPTAEAPPATTEEAPPATTEEALPAFTTNEAGVLTVGSDIPFPPFEFRKQGELTGFDVELAEEMASRLGLTTNWVDTDFDTIFTQLAAGRFDMVVSATTITPEREEQVNFTDGYFLSQQALTVNVEETPDIASTADLGEGDVVAVQKGTTGEIWARENLEPNGVKIRSFPDAPATYIALEAGNVTGVIFDEPSAIAEAADRPALEVVELIDTGEVYGIAVDPANEALLEAANIVLAEMIADGTYAEIYARYPVLPPGGNIAEAG